MFTRIVASPYNMLFFSKRWWLLLTDKRHVICFQRHLQNDRLLEHTITLHMTCRSRAYNNNRMTCHSGHTIAYQRMTCRSCRLHWLYLPNFDKFDDVFLLFLTTFQLDFGQIFTKLPMDTKPNTLFKSIITKSQKESNQPKILFKTQTQNLFEINYSSKLQKSIGSITGYLHFDFEKENHMPKFVKN